jgi:hypothetical protein
MAICGLNPNVDAITGELSSKVAGFLDLETSFTSPSGITSYLSTFESGIDAIKAKVDLSLPDIPFSTSGLTSLRDQLSAYVSVPSISGLTDITSKFGDLSSLTGMADFNLSDMASSALSLGGSFDPCSLAGDLKIPNIVADATGALQALPSIQPLLGDTTAAESIKEIQSVTNSVAASFADNITSAVGDSVPSQLAIIQSNSSTYQKIRLPDEIPVLSSGKPAVQDDGGITEDMKNWTAEEAASYISEIIRLHGEGKVGCSAVMKAAALKKYHAASYEAHQQAKVTNYARENPEFNDPTSDKYHMMWGRFKVEEVTSPQTGNTIWSKA